jgi:predicted enzyme related to lactoylglutathione lyase
MSAPVVWFEIIGKDGKKLQNFYGELFNWKINADNPMQYGMVDAAGSGTDPGKGSIGGGIGAAQPGEPGHVTFYVQVDEPDAYLRRIEKLGGRVIVPTTEIPNMVTFALFADPEGNMVGLVKSS